MLKKILALSLSVLMIACLFTGCKQDEVKEPTETPEVEVTQPSDTESETTDTTKPEENTTPGEIQPPIEEAPEDSMEDHGDLFVFTAKFKNDFAYKDDNVTVVFEDCIADNLGAAVNVSIEDSLNRQFAFSFTKGAYVNNCLIWPDIFYNEETGKYLMTLTDSDLGIYGIRDIHSFKAEDVEVYDAATGEVCKVITLNAQTDSTIKNTPKEGEVLMSIKDVEVIQYYTEYGYAVKEPVFVIKNNANDVYAFRMTKLVIDGQQQEIDPIFGEQATIKGTSAIYPFKAMIEFGMCISLYDVTSVVCDFEIYNVTTGMVATSVKNVEVKL